VERSTAKVSAPCALPRVIKEERGDMAFAAPWRYRPQLAEIADLCSSARIRPAATRTKEIQS
jgi:hypothetical protein